MIKIGITGQAGFIGTHLYNTISLKKDSFVLIPFEDTFFESDEMLDLFVVQCDVIVHLAAMNRHADPEVLYSTNIRLVKKLIDSMERCKVRPYVIMSSSLQEERDNLYGRSKREGRELFNAWARRNSTCFTGLIIPNVFGPFGVPYYNSVISTFSYQVVEGEEPRIEVDAELKLIYVGDLVKKIIDLATEYTEIAVHVQINTPSPVLQSKLDKVPQLMHIEHQAKYKVTELLDKIRGYHEDYAVKGVFPDLSNYFDVCLFNTYRSYLPLNRNPILYVQHTDSRGAYVEAMKSMSQGQTAFSTTVPGITRGNHFHLRKIERFAVINGKASIKLRRYGCSEGHEFILDGEAPAYVDMPIWYTHNITNIGDTELLTLFWINEFYDPSDPDTYFEEV